MGIRRAAIALVLLGSWPCVALAQTDAGAAPTAGATEASTDGADADEAAVEASVEATLEEASEPMPETPPGYETTTVPTPPARPTSAAPHRIALAQAADAERAVETAPVSEPDIELALTLNGLLSISTTTTPVLVANADLVFALDPRVWIGLGIAFSYSEQHSMAFPGVPDMKFVTSSVSVPLIFQYYFDAPHVGAAVPTLRVLLTPGWSETPVGSPIPSTQVVTGSAAVLAGITWMAAQWIALRIIGGVNGGFGVNVVGPINILGNIGVQALVSAVIRF